MRREEKIKRILENYGGEHQIAKCSEECSELLVELNRVLVKNTEESFEEAMKGHKIPLISELSDVYVTIMQVAELVGRKQFEKMVDYKIDRQLSRMVMNDGRSKKDKDGEYGEVL